MEWIKERGWKIFSAVLSRKNKFQFSFLSGKSFACVIKMKKSSFLHFDESSVHAHFTFCDFSLKWDEEFLSWDALNHNFLYCQRDTWGWSSLPLGSIFVGVVITGRLREKSQILSSSFNYREEEKSSLNRATNWTFFDVCFEIKNRSVIWLISRFESNEMHARVRAPQTKWFNFSACRALEFLAFYTFWHISRHVWRHGNCVMSPARDMMMMMRNMNSLSV